MKKIQKLLPEARIWPTGSRYICDPPHFGTDVDFLIYCSGPVHSRLEDAGYVIGTFTEYLNANRIDEFTTWRRGVVNLIVTRNADFAEKHVVATHICKHYNTKVKMQRIVVHEALRGAWTHELVEGWAPDLVQECKQLLANINGPYGRAMYVAYKIRHSITP